MNSFINGLKQEWNNITFPTKQSTVKRVSLTIVTCALLSILSTMADVGAQKLIHYILEIKF